MPANLEVFKFGLYLFFPIAIMVQFGDYEWYRKYVIPYRARISPREGNTFKPPTDRTEMRAELEKLKARKIARRLERQKSQAVDPAEEEQDRLV